MAVFGGKRQRRTRAGAAGGKGAGATGFRRFSAGFRPGNSGFRREAAAGGKGTGATSFRRISGGPKSGVWDPENTVRMGDLVWEHGQKIDAGFKCKY